MGNSVKNCLTCNGSKQKKSQTHAPQQAVNQAATIDYRKITQRYKFTETVLGAGNFGKVFLAESISDPDFRVAIKTIAKKSVKNKLEQLKDEIRILSSLDHPNVVKYYETYESPNYLYLVMEFCHGGELFKRLTENRADFTEQKAARVMQALFLAVNHLHSKGIAHRDLKPENVMYGTDDRVKIIDFGLSKLTKLRNGARAKFATVVGTPYYLAPEVLHGDYGRECDCWSLGVIMYVILSGYLPFYGKNQAEVYQVVKQGQFHFEHQEFEAVQPSAMDLISKLLCPDKTARLSCADALKHPWFTDALSAHATQQPLDQTALRALSEYKGNSTLKREAMNILVKMLDETKVSHLRKTFQEIDADRTGMISFQELQQAFEQNATTKMTRERIKSIMQNVDHGGNGMIQYTEFLAATVQIQEVMTEQKLFALFKHFDTDNSDFITPDNLREAFGQSGRSLSEPEMAQILREHDQVGDGRLCFEEFKAIFFENTTSRLDITGTSPLRSGRRPPAQQNSPDKLTNISQISWT